MKKFFNNLTFKVAAVIIFVEALVFSVTGFLYTARFGLEIDHRVKTRMEIPGILIKNHLLDYSSITERRTMGHLVGQELVEGMIIDNKKMVIRSLNPAYEGKHILDIGFQDDLFLDDLPTGVIKKVADKKNNYLISIFPIPAFDGKTIIAYVYIKVNTNKAEREKRSIARMFILGSAAVIMATSLVILVVFYFSIGKRIKKILRKVQNIEKGDISAETQELIIPDEIGTLQRGVNAMSATLKNTLHSLNERIGELKEAEKSQEQLISKLEAQNAELERFTYTISHDLKSPLITTKCFLEILESEVKEGNMKNFQENIAYIDTATSTMEQLLEELLELAKIGRVIDEKEHFSLKEAVEGVFPLFYTNIQEKNIHVEIDPSLPQMYGDYKRIKEVFQNLIGNAIKFMGEVKDPFIAIGMETKNNQDCFFVRDNGIGIEPQFHQRIFGLFDRIDSTVEGTGVGLAIVKRIIEVHGGKIWVESFGKGQGSTFYFTLPKEENEK